MINKKFVEKLKKDHAGNNAERRQIIALANVVLHDSKRVIFSLHRGDMAKAGESLLEIEKILLKLEKNFGHVRLYSEGSYKAAVEEYAEAKCFWLVENGKKIDKFSGINLDYETYLGGICDLVGELVRRAVNRAAEGDYAEVAKIGHIANEIMAELVEFDMAGYLRTKYDQAKGHLRKIEQVSYDISIRKK